MSERDRSPRTSTLVAIVVVAVFIGAAISGYGWWAQLQSQWDSDRRSAQYTKSTYYPAYDACLSATVPEKTNCIAEAHEEYRANQRGERDLVAQETTAGWTIVMSTAAIFGIVLSVVGVALIWGTFRETRETNQITREIGRAQVRAYLFFEVHETKLHARRRPSAVVIVKNFGSSPAIDIRLGGAVVVRPKGWIWPLDENDWVNEKPSSLYLAPGGSKHFDTEIEEEPVLTVEDQLAVRQGDLCLYGRAIATYKDVFGSEHETVLCFEFSGEACWQTRKVRVAMMGGYAT